MTRLLLACVLVTFAAVQAQAAQDADVDTQAQSEDGAWGVVRVIAELAEVHTGPGFTYRTIYTASRGETLRALQRATRDHWFYVQLPDGTYGWVLGDQVLPMAVDPSAPELPGFFGRMADAIFAPAPLASGDVGLAFSAGLLGGEGLVMFRPSVLLAPHLAIEGFVGETVGDQLDIVYYGGTANLFLWPTSPVTFFVSMGGGGVWARKKADIFLDPPRKHQATATAGGGLLIAFKKRVTLRFDARNYVLFSANHTQEAQEYSGGLAVVF